jgi:hypothetical protein
VEVLPESGLLFSTALRTTSHSRINASTAPNSLSNLCRHPFPTAFRLARLFPSTVRGPVECAHALRAFIIRE